MEFSIELTKIHFFFSRSMKKVRERKRVNVSFDFARKITNETTGKTEMNSVEIFTRVIDLSHC